MKIEVTKEWCMNMAKIEARAAELHEGCRMPMEQARALAASEAAPDWYARGQDWGLADALTNGQSGDWVLDDIARAFAAGAQAGGALESKRHADALRCALEALDYCIEDSAELLNERTAQWSQHRKDRQAAMAATLERHRAVAERLREMLRA